MASFAGPTSGGYARTTGRSAIWSAGAAVLAGADNRPGRIARVKGVFRVMLEEFESVGIFSVVDGKIVVDSGPSEFRPRAVGIAGVVGEDTDLRISEPIDLQSLDSAKGSCLPPN